jgi:outer membrane protein TolC
MRHSVYIWILAAVAGVLVAEEPLRLEEAIEFAIEDNLSLTTAKLRDLFPELQQQIAGEAFAWQIQPRFRIESREGENGEARARLEAGKLGSYGTLFRARAEWIERMEGESGPTAELTVEQPLFRRGGRLYTRRNVDRADYQRATSHRRLQQETEALVLRVVEAYTSAVYGRELEKQERAAVQRAEDLLRLVRIRRRQGRATPVDELEMDLLRRQAGLRLERVVDTNIQTLSQLAELMGRVPAQLPPLDPVEVPEEEFPDLGESETLARAHRLEREQALADYAEARRQLSLQQRELYPDVRVVARYRPETRLEDEEWFAGVSGGQDLDLQITRLEIQQEQAAVQAALSRIAAVELRISREVRDVHSRLRAADRELLLARDQVRLSEERYRLARGLYPSGRVDAQSLRDAEEEWVRAQTELKDAVLERVRIRYQFWYTLGLLLGEA